MKRHLAIGSLVLVCAAGCGNSQQQQAEEAAKKVQEGAEQMQRGAEQMAQGAQNSQQMAQGFQQMAQGSAKPVEYEALKDLLPQISGWTQSNARGEQISMPMSYSKAEARYAKDDSRVELEIVDSALSQMLLAPMTMFLASGYSERSDDGFKRSTKVGSYPAFEEWRTESKRGEVTALVNNRFIVTAKGNNVTDMDVVRHVVESVDLGKLAALK